VVAEVLPDFRNLGVIARILLAVNAAAFAAALFATPDLPQAAERFAQAAAFIEPLLLLVIVVLFALARVLRRLPYWAGIGVVLVLAVALAAGYTALVAAVSQQPVLPSLPRVLMLVALVTCTLLAYLHLLAKAYSPALAEARLQALQARIRPHFLFNSLNAVLALIRRDPQRAERTLEDLADLFRTLMSDARRFVRLADELALLERYAEIEQLRLGERLRITWELDGAPNHGVEPATEAAEVLVRIERRGNRVLALIENPYSEAEAARAGNRMALENIRERLQLFFDAEARIATQAAGGRYRVEIEIPYKVNA
jgi:two-component system sensor histidine kinase AlgZ